MKQIFSAAILIFCFMSCKVSHTQKAGSEGKLLEKAYQEHSSAKLESFFKRWQRNEPTLSSSELDKLDDTEKKIYQLFTALYEPNTLSIAHNFDAQKSNIKASQYLISQSSIRYCQADKVYYSPEEADSCVIKNMEMTIKPGSYLESLLWNYRHGKMPKFVRLYGPYGNIRSAQMDTSQSKVITDFRPEIRFNNKQVLYLTKKYDTLLRAFLNKEDYSWFSKHPRAQFLDKFIKLERWNDYWDIKFYPVITKIIFDKNFQYAMVYIQGAKETAETMLKNDSGKWRVISAIHTGYD
ncbi:MAG: hypothetical protein JWR50_1771 [Mucilaginibacter sp.]|nr:hypothetical protein [Mucilaginibacter sp.]